MEFSFLSKHKSPVFKINLKDNKSSSSEDKCPICLVIPIEDKSFADKCLHAFCKVCLVEWSKVRLECPLCRQEFKNIIYDFKSENDYKQIRLGELIRNRLSSAGLFLNSVGFSPFFSSGTFRVTNPPFFLNNNRFNNLEINHHVPGSLQHRRYIYSTDQYVLPGGDGLMRRRRESSPQFYRQNPTSTHRLMNFLNLEIRALIHNPNDHEIITSIILSSLTKFNINSIGFQRLISQYFLSRTIHFIHEFYNFAISEFTDLNTYFNEAVYLPKDQSQIVQISSISEPDNDQQNNEPFNLINPHNNRFSISRNIYNELNNNSLFNIQHNSNNNLIDGDNLSSIESNDQITSDLLDSDDSDIEIVYEGASDPTTSSNQINRNKNLNQTIEDEEPKPSTSGLQNTRLNNLNSNQTNNRQFNYSDSDSDYSDDEYLNRKNNFFPFYEENQNEIDDESVDCEIIECEPKKPKTPELVLLTTDDEDEEVNQFNSKRLKTENYNLNNNEMSNGKIIKINMTCRCKIKCKGICKKNC